MLRFTCDSLAGLIRMWRRQLTKAVTHGFVQPQPATWKAAAFPPLCALRGRTASGSWINEAAHIAVTRPGTNRCYADHVLPLAAGIAGGTEPGRHLQQATIDAAQQERGISALRGENEALRRLNDSMQADGDRLKAEVGRLKAEKELLKKRVARLQRDAKRPTPCVMETLGRFLRHFATHMHYRTIFDEHMTTTEMYAADTLPPEERARYAGFLAMHPQLNEMVWEAIDQLPSRIPTAHRAGRARRATPTQLKTEIVLAFDGEGTLNRDELRVVDDLVQVLMDTPAASSRRRETPHHHPFHQTALLGTSA